MIVVTESPSDSLSEENDYQDFYRIFVDGKRVASFHDGEPEDNTLSRNFNDCFSIGSLMKRAWQAGKDGEEFTLEEKELSEDD